MAKTPEEIVNELSKEVKDALVGKFGELEAWKQKHDAELKACGDAGIESKNAIASITKEIGDLNAKMTDILQKGSRRGAVETARSVGEQIVASDAYGSFRNAGAVGFSGKIPVVLGATLTKDSGGAGIVVPTRVPDFKGPGQDLFAVRSLFAAGTTDSNAIEFVKETGFTNSAAGVAEGAKKPESSIEFLKASAVVRTLAHWLPVSKQLIDDSAQLQSYIDARMIYGLSEVEENQIINGNGTGENLSGIKTAGTAYDTSLNDTGDTIIDTIANAILQVRKANFPANGIIMNPVDVHKLRKLKDSIGRYMFDGPSSAGEIRLWGLRLVESNAMAAGTFSVGAYNLAAQIYDRQGATVELSEHDQDNFVRNTITIRCEERLALVTYRPEAIVYGSFPTGS